MKNSAKASSDKSDLCTNLHSSQNHGHENASDIVIGTQEELESLYKSVGKDDIPAIDFTKSQVVVLFLGAKNTGGYSISIDRVEEENGKLVVYKKIEKPAPGAMVTMALTSPFVIAEIKSKKEIIFK